jgi:3-methyladenine DNA glycosylase AlkD
MDAINQLRHQFVSVAVRADAAPMAAYMKQIAPFLGVKADARRRMVRQWCDQLTLTSVDDVLILAQRLLAESEREFHYAAADMAAYWVRLLDASFVDCHVEHLLLEHPWWDTVDLWGSDVINPLCVRYDCTETLWRWNASGNRWLIRASIQHQRGRKRDYDVDLVLAMCEPHVVDTEFFVAKAIGWALRDMAKYHPDRIRQFIELHPQLSSVARREAVRGIMRLGK